LRRDSFGIRDSGFFRVSSFVIRHFAGAFPVLLVIRNAEGDVRWMECAAQELVTGSWMTGKS